MAKYTLDVFTLGSLGSKFPENTFDAETPDQVADIVHNCTRINAGIRKVEVWINEPDDREPIKTAEKMI